MSVRGYANRYIWPPNPIQIDQATQIESKLQIDLIIESYGHNQYTRNQCLFVF